jgi:hypothetical protein
LSCKYIVMGFEVGKSGTPHLQGYVEFDHAKTFSACKKCIGNKCHIENRRGSSKQASDYCKKDGEFYEFGELSSQGARADLLELKSNIMSGSMTVDDVVLDDPVKYHQYGRTLNKIEDLRLRKLFRNFTTKGIWLYGPTGVGKSHHAFEGYTPKTHYSYPYDNGWWDGYCCQNVTIINEFRGEIKYSKMLDMVDKYPFMVKRRNREPLPFMSKIVIVTSSLPPECVYEDCGEDIGQLYRRFCVYRIEDKNTVKKIEYINDDFNKYTATIEEINYLKNNALNCI